MADLGKVLSGTKILEKANSSVNGQLTVVKDFAWGIHIKAAGLTQTGGIAVPIWRKALKKAKSNKKKVTSCLILGLGGGSGAMIVRQLWPDCKITGVDIDKKVVELGKKYLGLNDLDVNIVIQDAQKYCEKNKSKYDLILIDMYIGDEVPERFKKRKFFELVKRLVAKDGLVLVNRLYYGDKRRESVQTHEVLEKVFARVEPVFPEANVIFICSE